MGCQECVSPACSSSGGPAFAWNESQRQILLGACPAIGLRSSPAIWERYANMIEQILKRRTGTDLLCHHVDDYLHLFSDEKRAHECLGIIKELLSQLGVPMSLPKLMGPCQRLPFCGFTIDTLAQTVSITVERKAHIVDVISRTRQRKTVTHGILRSLVGKTHLCVAHHPGWKGFR